MPRRHVLNLLEKIGRIDWLLLLVVTLAVGAGVVFIYSATWTSENPELRLYHARQLSYGLLGLGVCGALSLIDYHRILRLAPLVLIIGYGLLVAVLVFGTETHGSKSWFDWGVVRLQPAELAKLALIIFLAWFLGRRAEKAREFSTFFWASAATGGCMGLVVKQPDLGSALVFAPVAFVMMYVAGVRKRWLLMGVIVGVVGAIFAYAFVLKGYQQDRLTSFLYPERDPEGRGYHVLQSIKAVGSGGMFGRGFMEGKQSILGFLPKDVSFSDFIFSVVGEEFGFVGSVILLSVFAIILLMGLNIAVRAIDLQGALLAVGVCTMLFTHIFENIGMTIGVTPITGIPLPLISYGGTFVVTCLAGIGLLQSVQIHRRTD
jgi:rod shape determining protein RodA